MTLPSGLGSGGTGFHGEGSAKIRDYLGFVAADADALHTSVATAITILNEVRADRLVALAQLDADAGVTDTNYATVGATTAPAVAVPSVALAILITAATNAATLANELKADQATIHAKLDADVGVTDANYAATIAIAAADATAPTTLGTARSTVGGLVTLANELKADHNSLVAKLDADAGVTDTDYAANAGIAAVDASTYTA